MQNSFEVHSYSKALCVPCGVSGGCIGSELTTDNTPLTPEGSGSNTHAYLLCETHHRLFFKNEDFIYFFRGGEGREKERERNTDVRDLQVDRLGTEPAPQAQAVTGNQTGDLSLCRTMPNQLNHTGQGWLLILGSTRQPCAGGH